MNENTVTYTFTMARWRPKLSKVEGNKTNEKSKSTTRTTRDGKKGMWWVKKGRYLTE